jgi:hypothetical protein
VTTNEGSVDFDDSDHPLALFFHKAVLSALVYIECRNLSTNEITAGTGTVFAYQGNAKDGWLPLILTAGHVIRPAIATPHEYRLTRYSWANPVSPTARTAIFRSGETGSRSPCVNYYTGPGADVVDTGFIRGPKCCEDGQPFLNSNEDSAPLSSELVPIETDWNWAAEGTRVAWAGFPAVAMQIANRPTPCYFEGSVAALILNHDKPLYLLDGHNTFGVSGGPVWAWCKHRKHPRIIGSISSYRFHGSNALLPGFTHAVPIQPLWQFLEKNWGAKRHLAG